MSEHTTIQISTETRDKLVALGKKNQSYDSILTELLETMDELDKLEIKKEVTK